MRSESMEYSPSPGIFPVPRSEAYLSERPISGNVPRAWSIPRIPRGMCLSERTICLAMFEAMFGRNRDSAYVGSHYPLVYSLFVV